MFSYLTSFWSSAAPTENPIPADKKAAYEKSVAEHKEKVSGWSPFYKHIWYVVNKETLESTPGSVTGVLQAMHGSKALLKGPIIHYANADHRGTLFKHCPFTSTTDLKPSLHLGTTRVWNKEGNIDEQRWQDLLKNASDQNQTIIPYSKFQAWLKQCAANDPEEQDTGRHIDDSRYFGKRDAQLSMAVHGWDEVFEDLACGWVLKPDNSGKYEAFLTRDLMRLFFEDSGLAYKKAEYSLLPLPNPDASSHQCRIM